MAEMHNGSNSELPRSAVDLLGRTERNVDGNSTQTVVYYGARQAER